uniref:Transposase n=1 Tax=Mesocestoides corti TaxID=53468 RepID=A0A5K3FDF4_MESCO
MVSATCCITTSTDELGGVTSEQKRPNLNPNPRGLVYSLDLLIRREQHGLTPRFDAIRRASKHVPIKAIWRDFKKLNTAGVEVGVGDTEAAHRASPLQRPTTPDLADSSGAAANTVSAHSRTHACTHTHASNLLSSGSTRRSSTNGP